ncbi:MAG TPA: alanine racemase [Aeromicrobium sp.]|nr:alanine racemase [Aeromicrobium sp.]
MFCLHIDRSRWRSHLDQAATAGVVPVVKGNGYGFGRELLFAEADRLGADLVAVGTYAEVPGALAGFTGEVMVLTPWRPFLTDLHAVEPALDPRVVHTVGRVEDVAELAARAPGARVVVEGETSMSRHGLDRHELAEAVAALGELVVDGFAIHLPLTNPAPGGNLGEAQSWAGALLASQLQTTTLYVSHLSAVETTVLAESRPQLTVRRRIGTSLWLGDLSALSVRARVLDRHTVARGERIGYRQRTVPRDGVVLVVAGGTSHGVGLEAPRVGRGVLQRGKTFAKGGLEAAGLSLSPFSVEGKQRWFAEPPHMQVSLIFLPADVAPPAVGATIEVAVRYTTATFDEVVWE